jgi:hypothetical protein
MIPLARAGQSPPGGGLKTTERPAAFAAGRFLFAATHGLKPSCDRYINQERSA